MVALPSVSKLAATAEFHNRLGGVGMFCEEEQRRGPDGKLLCLVCDQRQPKRTVPLKKMRQHVTATLRGIISLPMPADSAALVAFPPILLRRRWVCRLACSDSLLLPVCHHLRKLQHRSYAVPPPPRLTGCSMLLWKYGMEDHWDIAHPDHQPG
jgi:hypothetical protein